VSFLEHKIKGIGLGLRFSHFEDILKFEHQCPWFEVITEDFLQEGSHQHKLLKLRKKFPIAFHSVGLNIGGVDSIDLNYLKRLKFLYQKFEPTIVSDHLCWSSHQGKFHYDLLPIPRTRDGLNQVCERISFVQEYLDRELVIENITSYIEYKECDFEELDFLKAVSNKTGCFFLLDITNVLINFENRKKNPENFLMNFPLDRVKQIHLAGGTNKGNIIIDTHSEKVSPESILELQKIYQRGYDIPAIIERDSNIPPFLNLEEERQKIETQISL